MTTQKTIGIFTPVHKLNEENLAFLAKSLDLQYDKNFIWLLLLNGEALEKEKEIEEIIKEYAPTVNSSIRHSKTVANIGSLKGECCDILIDDHKVDILFELDYDDALRQDCIKVLLQEAEDNPEAVFFFSNFAHFGINTKGEFESFTYGEFWGWKHRKTKNKTLFGDKELNEMLCFPGKVQYLYRIESAPNHFRAFRVEPYREINGYDKTLPVGDDHDLVCRFYKKFGDKGFKHIEKCLYYQRYDSSTTTHTQNGEIQTQVDKNYVKHSERMFKKWAKDNKLLCLDLGGRFNCPLGYKSVDLQDADFIVDLNKEWSAFPTDSVGVLRAYHLLEHLDDPIHFFNEAYRVLAPGGVLLIEVPSLRGPHAFADPTHKSFWTELNFDYYTNEAKARFIRPQYKGAFQVMRMKEYAWPDGTLCISAQLISLKGWYGDNHWGLKQTGSNFIQNGHS